MESKKRKSEGAPPRQLKLKSLFAAVELEEKTAEIEDEEPLLISTVVPHSWLIENRSRVRWPSHLPTDVISNYVMRRVTPKDHWGTFKVMKVIPLACELISQFFAAMINITFISHITYISQVLNININTINASKFL